MTDISQFHKLLMLILLGLTLSAPASFAATKVYDLRNPDTEITEPLSISQGGVLALQLAESDKAWFNDEPLFIGAGGRAIIALHRDDTEAVLRIISADGEETVKSFAVQRRDYRIERIDGLPPAKVTAPRDPEVTARIRAEARAIRKARERLDDRQDFLSGFIWPVKGRISGVYGSQRVLNGEPKTPHYGVDVAVPTGTKVVAPADGIIIYTNPDMYYSGGTLVIDHGHGLSSAFLHLSKIDVAVGDRVKQGQYVARVGSTGRSTGPHLDWRMNLGTSTRIDPQLLVQPMQVEQKTTNNKEE